MWSAAIVAVCHDNLAHYELCWYHGWEALRAGAVERRMAEERGVGVDEWLVSLTANGLQ